MANTQEKTLAYGGLYERTRDYLKEKTALFGLIRWEEVVHSEQLDNDLVLKIETKKIPTIVYINGEEYKLSKVISLK